MRAAVMHGKNDIRIEEVPEPAPGPGELLLEVSAAGVCGTDAAEFYEGPKLFPIPGPSPLTGQQGPMIPGHEFGGRVVAIGEGVVGYGDGDLVASGAGVSCGVCFQCRKGHTSVCTDYWTVGLQRNGALARFVAVPASACLNVSNVGLSADATALVQPMSIAVHSSRRGRPEPDEDVVVVGAGGIGAFLVYALAASGMAVVAIDLDADRLEMAKRLGARDVVLGGTGTIDRLAEVSPRPRVVYEASGSTAGLDLAFAASPPAARIVAVGHQHHPYTLDVRRFSLEERELIGTNAHAFAADFPTAAGMIAERRGGWSDIAPLALPLEDLVPVALAEMRSGTSARIKTLLDPVATEPRNADV